jgi:hypothetical protein
MLADGCTQHDLRAAYVSPAASTKSHRSLGISTCLLDGLVHHRRDPAALLLITANLER